MTGATLLEPAPRPMRADAMRNRERVIRAAYEVLAEQGLTACVDDVAARAGVGRATVYRNFQSKEHLMAAVACAQLRWFEQLAEEAYKHDDAWEAFTELMMRAADAQAANRAIAASMDSLNEMREVQEARAAAAAALERLMRRARRQGAMRSDARSRDVWVLFGGVGRALAQDEQSDEVVWRRYATLIVDAMRPPREPTPSHGERAEPSAKDGEG